MLTDSSRFTLFEQLWRRHVVREPTDDGPAIVYVDLHWIHEVTSPQAFGHLRERGLPVRRPERTVATMDHSIPTRRDNGRLVFASPEAEAQVDELRHNCEQFGIRLFPLGDARQGIVHVIGPELGLTQPGMTLVCGDSHTATHGAFGAWAFGIGSTEVAHVLATQCLALQKPKTMEIAVTGRLGPGVTAKDLILAIIARIGVAGGRGHVIEYTGGGITSLSMEERMTICNMSIEAGARAGLVAPDDTTFEYLAGRPHAPKGASWDEALADWRTLRTGPKASYDKTVSVDASGVVPMVTYGTNPAMSIGIDEPIPSDGSQTTGRALEYMGFAAGERLAGRAVDTVFIGSCTNARLSDLRLAAAVLRGRRVAKAVRMLVVPGSQDIKRRAEEEGLHLVFRDAGAEWREPGCSMCIAMNGDELRHGELAVSTSNRNFEGRQGAGGRTILASPLTAAATAVAGEITDARSLTSRSD